MLAAAILGILSLTVFQFTSVAVKMTGISAQESAQAQACDGFRRLLETQLASLPINQNGSLIGIKIDRKGGGERDALQLVCPAGNALLTPDARGLYEITLTLRELPRGSGHYSLGMERTPWEDDDDDSDDDEKVSSAQVTDVTKQKEVLPSDWVTLMEGVTSLEFKYFDVRLNEFVPKWPDANAMPSLVKVRLTVGENRAPYEIVERVPGGNANLRALPTFDTSVVPTANNDGNPNRQVQRPPNTGGQPNLP